MTGRGYRATFVIVDEVQLVDETLDALSAGRLGDDTELVFEILARWRRECLAAPVPELVDVRTASALIRAAVLA